MQKKIRSEEYRSTVVCIDSYENDIPKGCFFHPYIETGQSFSSLTQFLRSMEQVLDRIDFPASFSAIRSFAAAPPSHAPPANVQYRPGKLSTFSIRILFRQNASWQGSIHWLEGQQEQSFRSVLELVFLIHSALTQSRPLAS